MDYRILGPLEIGLNGSSFTIKGRKPRAASFGRRTAIM